MTTERRENNPDWIERQKPCDICGQPIGTEAMVTGVQSRYHARCVKEIETQQRDGQNQ